MRLKTPPVTLTGKIERLVPGENVTLVNGKLYSHMFTGAGILFLAHIERQVTARQIVGGWAVWEETTRGWEKHVNLADVSPCSLDRKQRMARAARDRFQRYRRSSVAGKFWSSGFPAAHPASRAGSTTSHRSCLPESRLAYHSYRPESISFGVSGSSATCRASYTCGTRAVPVSGSASPRRRHSPLQVLLRRSRDSLNGQAAC